jgi:SAM-dependent methyltransferase
MSPALPATRRYFEKRADAIDRFYAQPTTGNHVLRRGPWRGRELAFSLLTRNPGASVLDLGCGPGRVAESVIEAGAASYVGIDLSAHMLALAGKRLDRFATVELVEGDFLDLDVPRAFDIVLALGLFDYLAEPARAAEWMRARCSSTLLASFTRWDWLKGPIRHFHYELLHRCPIHDYTESGVEAMLRGAGFSGVEFVSRGRRGFFVEAGP